MNLELWHYAMFSLLIGAISGYFIGRRSIAYSVAALAGWLLMAAPSWVAMQSPSLSAVHHGADEFFWSLVLLPGCIVSGLVGAFVLRFLAHRKRSKDTTASKS